MKRLPTLLLLLFVGILIKAQSVTTLAGPTTGINDAISVDSKGNIYGSKYNGSFNGSSIYKVTPEGEVSVFADGFTCTNGNIIDENDNLFVVNVASGYQNQIYKITPDGTKTPHGPIISGAGGLVKDPNSDTIYVGCYPDPIIGKLAPDGTYTEFITGGDLNGPVGMAFDDDGNLYAANYGNGKVFKIESGSTETNLIAEIPGSSFGSVGFLTYARGNLYATGIGKHRIYRIPITGGFVELIGTGSSGSSNGGVNDASFSNPNGIAVSTTGDSLFISDYTSQSIRVITDYDAEIETISPKVDSIVIVSNKKLRVYFTERLEETSAKNKDNYTFSNDINLSILSLYNSSHYVELHISELDLENEEYTLSLTNIYDVHNNAISDTIIYFNKTTTTIENKGIQLNIFPNPVNNGNLNIETDKKIDSIYLYDISGKLIMRKAINLNIAKIDMIKYETGLYHLQVIFQNKEIASVKIIN